MSVLFKTSSLLILMRCCLILPAFSINRSSRDTLGASNIGGGAAATVETIKMARIDKIYFFFRNESCYKKFNIYWKLTTFQNFRKLPLTTAYYCRFSFLLSKMTRPDSGYWRNRGVVLLVAADEFLMLALNIFWIFIQIQMYLFRACTIDMSLSRDQHMIEAYSFFSTKRYLMFGLTSWMQLLVMLVDLHLRFCCCFIRQMQGSILL